MKKLRATMILFGILFIALCSSKSIFAAPMNGEEFHFKQPDGTYVDVKVFGDEFYQRVESLDGYTLVRDAKTQYICYAKLNENKSDFVSTGIVYGKKESKHSLGIAKGLELNKQHILEKVEDAKSKLVVSDSQDSNKKNEPKAFSALRTLGGTQNIKGLTIVIEFPQGGTSAVPINQIKDYLNKSGYSSSGVNPNNGSIRDYFWDVSGGKVDYENFVFQYTAQNNKAYYDRIDGYPNTSLQLIQEAFNALKSNTSFLNALPQLTRKANGEVLALNVLYAGSPDWGWSKGLWPHSWGVDVATINGVKFKGYQITNIGNQLTLRTFAHENGHMLFGFPDLYDYTYATNGAGNFCLMSYGGSDTNPVPPCLYIRNKAGWATARILNQYEKGTNITAQSNSIWGYQYLTILPNEFFTLEYIQKINRYASFPGNGFVISHIDENGSNTTGQGLNPLVSIVSADNQAFINYNYGSQSSMFPYGSKNSIHSISTPNASTWSGAVTGFGLANINASGTFTYNPDMFLRNSNGVGFRSADRYFDTAYRNRVWPGDINGDGKKDIVAITIYGEVDYCLANNDGTFQDLRRINTRIFPSNDGWFLNDYTQRIWPADINGDKKVDFVGVHYDGRIFTAINNGNYTFGTFSAKGGLAFKSSEQYFDNTSRDRVWPADINGDGKDDLVSITFVGNIDYALSNGNGSFNNHARINANIFPTDAGWFLTSYTQRVWPADINGDKKVDFVGVASDGTIYTAINNGNYTFGTFSAKGGVGFKTVHLWFETSYRQRIWATDINNDKCADLIGLAIDGSMHCSYSNGNGTYKNSTTIAAIEFFPSNSGWFDTGFSQRIWPSDVNGSGRTNFVGVDYTGQIFYTSDLP